MVYNLIFQLYASETRMKKNSDIIYKINRLGFNIDDETNKIKVIIYTMKTTTKQINGHSSVFKTELRDIFLNEDIKTTTFKSSDDRYPRGYDYLHISDNDNQSYEYAGIFFHENSLKFLRKQKTWRLLEMDKTKNFIDRIKNFMYEYSQKELEKLIVFSSGVLYAYGIRDANDLDCLLLECDMIKPELIGKLNDDDLDISYKGTKLWNDNWETTLNERAVLFGAKDYNELVINPKFYFYFMGIKFLRLKLDILLRFKRGRPAQMTDLIVIRQMYNFKYTLKIPETTTEYNKEKKTDVITPVNKKKYLETIKYYLESRYYIKLNINDIEQWINNNLQNNNMQNNNLQNNNLQAIIKPDLNNNLGNKNMLVLNSKTEKMFYNIENIAETKIVYPSQEELIRMGYLPNIIIYSSDKPYLYPGEKFSKTINMHFCNRDVKEIKPKQNSLRVASFNLHNFVSRCNQGIAPLFGTALNPFDKPRDINKWLKLFKSVNADILCLQELVPISDINIEKDMTDINVIRNTFNFEFFNKKMEELGYVYKIIGSTMQGNFYDLENNSYYFLSNGIYSKIKLENSQIFQYKYLNRNIITATVNYNNKDIQIFNTHLEYYVSDNQILKNMGISNNHLFEQFNNLYELIECCKTDNIILCGDLNINLFKNSNNNIRYKNWEEKTKLFRNNFINTNHTIIPTNFSQGDQTDLILYHKKSKLKSILSFVVFTSISDHYLIFSDFI